MCTLNIMEKRRQSKGNPKHKQNKQQQSRMKILNIKQKKNNTNEYRTMGEQCVHNVCKNNNNNSKKKANKRMKN